MTLSAALQAWRAAALVAGAKVSPSLQQTEHRGVWIFAPDEEGDQDVEGDCGISYDTVVVTLRQHLAAGNSGATPAFDDALDFEVDLRTALVRSAGLARVRPRFSSSARVVMPGQAQWLESVLTFTQLRDDVLQ